MRRIYLDHAATTPLDPRVLEEMLPFLKEQYGNASSVHALGRKARFAVEESRERIAAHLGAAPGEIVFMSGATEANNLAIKGSAGGVMLAKSEHEAALRPAETIESSGRPVVLLDPTPEGAFPLDGFEKRLADGITLVSCMHANNEVGVLNDVAHIGARCRDLGLYFHSDVVQTVGWCLPRVDTLHIDLLSASAHKFYGPKGTGFLYVRGGVEVDGLIEGGSQERRRRGGTENVAGIVGMAKALDLAVEERDHRRSHIDNLRARLLEGLSAMLDDYQLMTPAEAELAVPHIVNIAFPPIDGEAMDGEMLILNMDMAGVCVSSGSACTSGAIEPSHVLLSMGWDRETASAAVRFSMGKDTSAEDIDVSVERLGEIVTRMRRRVSA